MGGRKINRRNLPIPVDMAIPGGIITCVGRTTRPETRSPKMSAIPASDFVRSLGTVAADETVTIDLDAVSSKLVNRVVVRQFDLNLVASQLYHLNREAYEAFVKAFPTADAGHFVGG